MRQAGQSESGGAADQAPIGGAEHAQITRE
jgi:hypothetical protein